MKTTLKIAAAVATTLMGMSAAHASIVLPSTGDSSLLFFLNDPSTHQTFTAVLPQSVSAYFAPTTGTGGVINTYNGDANFQINLAGDVGLAGFLSAAGADTLNWGILGGAYSGSTPAGSKGIGQSVAITTSSSTTAAILNVAQTSIAGAIASGINSDVIKLNLNLGSDSSTASGVIGTTASAGGTNMTLYSANVLQSGLIPSTSATPTGVTLYGLTGNGGNNGKALAYNLGTISFSTAGGADTLTFTGNALATPLPAAAWLFGSGLLGLAGIGRRKKTGVAA